MVTLSVRARVTVSVAAMLLPLVTVAGASAVALQRTLDSFAEAAAEVQEEALPLTHLQALVLQVERTGRQAVEQPRLDADAYRATRGDLQRALAELDEDRMTEERSLANGRRGAEQAVRSIDAALAEVEVDGAAGADSARWLATAERQVSTAVANLRAAAERSKQDVVEEYELARQVEQRAKTVIAVVTLLGLLAALIAGGCMAHSVLAPLGLLQEAARRLGQGVLSHRVVMPRRDDFGELGEAFNAMAAGLERSQGELEHSALHDALTGLPNRVLLHDRVEQALARRSSDGRQVALLLIDLDGFKAVNDSLGHGVGDEVLRSAAARLSRAVRAGDTAARLGGDEFAVLVESSTEGVVQGVAERVLHAMRRAFRCGDRELFLTASIGVAMAGADGSSSGDLLRDADLAMYRAKDGGKDGVRLYDAAMHGAAERRLQLEGDLRGALERGELALHYQPIYDIEGDPPVAVEALLRWNRLGQGLVPPADFIPVAESTGLIVDIGAWILDEACRQLRAWELVGGPTAAALQMSVNLSARQLHDDALVSVVQDVLQRHGVAPDRLTLEITESMMVHDVPGTIRRLRRLKTLGVQLAVDDFGTGYSSLGYLRQFPIDRLKIDKSFVDQLHESDGRALVEGIINLAGALGLEVVAEGVEVDEQRVALDRLGCRLAQGYHFAHPEMPDAVAERLAAASVVVASVAGT